MQIGCNECKWYAQQYLLGPLRFATRPCSFAALITSKTIVFDVIVTSTVEIIKPLAFETTAVQLYRGGNNVHAVEVATIVATAPQSGARPLRGHSMHVVTTAAKVAASYQRPIKRREAAI